MKNRQRIKKALKTAVTARNHRPPRGAWPVMLDRRRGGVTTLLPCRLTSQGAGCLLPWESPGWTAEPVGRGAPWSEGLPLKFRAATSGFTPDAVRDARQWVVKHMAQVPNEIRRRANVPISHGWGYLRYKTRKINVQFTERMIFIF